MTDDYLSSQCSYVQLAHRQSNPPRFVGVSADLSIRLSRRWRLLLPISVSHRDAQYPWRRLGI